MGIWQLPHCWLILLGHPREYKTIMVPNMLKVLSVSQLRNMVFVWGLGVGVTMLLLPLFGIISTHPFRWVLAANAICLMVVFAYGAFLTPGNVSSRYLSSHLNAALLMVMLLVILDKLLIGS